MQKKVLVFRSDYLPVSETFISDHLRSLARYLPLVVCERDMPAKHRVAVIPQAIAQGWLQKKLFKYFGISSVFNKIIVKEQPDIVHAHFLTDAAKILPLMERTKIPFVVTAHGYDATMYDEHLKTFTEGRLLLERRTRLIKRVDKIICVSEFIKEELKLKGYPAEKLVVAYLGVDLTMLPPRNVAPDKTKGILTVGRLVEKKGTRYLIEAYARLPAALRMAHQLQIIGDGPLRAELELLARSLNVSPLFLGAQPRATVIEHLKSASLFVLPSIRADNGDAEGMPIAIMEALATGVPICIFDDQPMAPLLKVKNAGLLASPRDANHLSVQIEGLLSDPHRASQVASDGQQLAKECFDLFANTKNLESIYDVVCASFTSKEHNECQ